MTEIRVPLRVKPGASRTKVGGRHGEDELIVAVHAPPVEGAANEAVITAVAKSLGIRPRQVRLISGHTARSKVLAVEVTHAEAPLLKERLKALLQ